MMPRQTVLNFPVGSFVEFENKSERPGHTEEIGTVVGLTVNMMGEPILMVHSVRRCIPNINMADLGYTPLATDSTHTFWERTGPMHPANVRVLNANTIL